MRSFAEVYSAYLELLNRPEPEGSPEERAAFWLNLSSELADFWPALEAELPLDAVEYMRQEVERLTSAEPELPSYADESDPVLLELWKGPA